MQIKEIWRYPIKGLSGHRLSKTVLNPGQGLPNDRRWALAKPGSDAASGDGWQPKGQFCVQVNEARLAQLKCRFDDVTGRFCFEAPDGLHAEGALIAPEGRAAIAGGVAKHLGLPKAETPVLVQAKEIGYFDSLKGPVSLLNLASHQALEGVMGRTLDPLRFRMNFWIEGMDAWAERDWDGKRIQIGPAILRITQQTGRCKATHIDPETGEEDAKIMHALKDNFGHTQMGIYAVVESGGPVKAGDPIQLLD